MNFLLFFISSVFAGIFYIFYKINLGQKVFLWWQEHFVWVTSISWNLFIETLVFLGAGIVMFGLFSNFSLFNKKEIEYEDDEYEGEYIEKESLLQRFSISVFLKKYLYYIGFILFYFSIFIILKSVWISDFSYFILILNIIIWILFFLTNKAELFRDFIKINTILFSLYYIFLYLYLLFFREQSVVFIDTLNTLFILSFFVITIYSDSKILKRDNSDNAIVLYFFLYTFIVSSYYIKWFFSNQWKDFLQVIVFISCLFNVIIYFFLQKLHFLENSKYLLRALSIFFSYIWVLFWIPILLMSTTWLALSNIAIFAILIYSLVFNYIIHQKFQNYISFFFSLFTAFFLLYFSVFQISLLNEMNFIKWEIIVTFFLSFSLVSVTYIYNMKYIYDYTFLHFCAYLVSILWIIYYFYYADFAILDLWIVLLLWSVLVFLSYFKLKKLNK